MTTVFFRLVNQSRTINPDNIADIERFVVVMYQKTSQLMNVNYARRELASKGNRSLEKNSPNSSCTGRILKDMHFKLALYGVCVLNNFQIYHIILTGGGRKMMKLGSLL